MTTEGPSPTEGQPHPADSPEPAPPPQPEPSSPPPTVPTPPTLPTPPTPPLLGEPINTGMSGCAKAAIIGGVIVVVLGALAAIAIFVFVRRVADNVEEAVGESPCAYISSEEASEILGSQVDAWSGDSVLGQILGVIQDTRLLSDSPSCFLSSDDSSVQMWISVYDGGDAADVFAAWAAVADGQVVSQSSDESGTLTVETDAFRGEDVPGLGEEAFCVEVGFTASGGVFARSDDRIVYVTTLPAGEDDVLSDDVCQRAVPIAAALLG